MDDKIRIQKLISQAGVCSRRSAEKLIKDQKVKINGKIAELGDKGTFQDKIIVNNKILRPQKLVYLLMNKPMKTICSLSDPDGKATVIELIKEQKYIFPVGRLDYLTTGILLLTNDGELANKLLHPKYQIKRLYKVKLDLALTKIELAALNSSKIKINGKTSRQEVVLKENKTYYVTLRQGWNHHVKNIFKYVDRKVISLTRLEFAGLNYRGVQIGKYRELTSKELKLLKALTNR